MGYTFYPSSFYDEGSGSDASFTGFAPSVEDACGAGVSVTDLNSTEYLGLFSDTVDLLNNIDPFPDSSAGLLSNNGAGSSFDVVIPAEDIEAQCEVRHEAPSRKVWIGAHQVRWLCVRQTWRSAQTRSACGPTPNPCVMIVDGVQSPLLLGLLQGVHILDTTTH